ncbi:MAG: hypothetical protein FWF37_01625 [Chloroflexi bacterium]|nr:hypothetical protein [Chloroflexota bacterium]
MTLKKKLIIISASVLVVLVVVAVMSVSYCLNSFPVQNDDYIADYAKLPISITTNTRLEQKDNKILAYLDIQITNNSKKTISSIQYYLTSTVYTKDSDGNERLFKHPNTLFTLPQLMWDGVKFIGSGKSAFVSIPIGEVNSNNLANDIDIVKIEYNLYINWIRYTIGQWGSHSMFFELDIHFSTITNNAPKIDVPTFVA